MCKTPISHSNYIPEVTQNNMHDNGKKQTNTSTAKIDGIDL